MIIYAEWVSLVVATAQLLSMICVFAVVDPMRMMLLMIAIFWFATEMLACLKLLLIS